MSNAGASHNKAARSATLQRRIARAIKTGAPIMPPQVTR